MTDPAKEVAFTAQTLAFISLLMADLANEQDSSLLVFGFLVAACRVDLDRYHWGQPLYDLWTIEQTEDPLISIRCKYDVDTVWIYE